MHQRAAASFQAGDVFEADRLCRAILAVDAGHFDALCLMAMMAIRRGQRDEAIALLGQALATDPRSAETWTHRANLLNAAGRFAESIECCDRAIALRADQPETFVVRGVAHHSAGRFADALADYDRALALRPSFAGALSNRAAALKDLQRYDEALAAYDRALELAPDLGEALTNRATVLVELGRYAEALASCDRAVAVAPGFHEAWHNRGVALVALNRHDEAIDSYSRAIALQPDFAPALQSRASALGYYKLYAQALPDYERALACDPDLPFVRGNLLHTRLHCGLWDGYAESVARLVADVRAGKLACEPLTFVAIGERADDALTVSRTWNRHYYAPSPTPLWRGERYAHERIRVAYLSADFHEHATAFLLAELFELHDRSRFEVTAVSWGPDSGSAMRARLKRAFEQFIDVRGVSDAEVARLLREREIDIAVDLKGYTFDARLGILARRPAPVQVSYLGYPGTLGAAYVDYLMADETVIPEEAKRHYAEQVVWLPDSYQVNDRKRAIGATPRRAAVGLPEGGVVFCSFNNNYKITPEVWQVWMRLLREVAGSVLWLLEGNAAAPVNLRREAAARGVSGERLVFAPRVGLAEHLARQRCADLFLDTLPCNAHTTASDALWAGLPVVTCLGRTFAGRVAGSLLRAVGLPELVTGTLEEYEAVALKLAREPESLAAVKGKLAANRLTQPLFDSERFCRQLESAYETMWARAQRGEPPQAFAVPPIP
ncbi:MAG: tetratricopeptide repeat protein [Burkholderiales bacterium]